MKRYKIGQMIEYSGYKWRIHSIIWIKDNNGKAKKLRLMDVRGDVKNTWEYICYHFSYCEINVNKIEN